MNKISLYEAMDFTESLAHDAFRVLQQVSPYQKEGIYQDVLIKELEKINIRTRREIVYTYIYGEDQTLGNNHCMRTDIELPDKQCILELKSLSNTTKTENLFQLRSYLEQIPKYHWGIVVNFISKYGNDVSPYVECTMLYRNDEELPHVGHSYSTKTYTSDLYPKLDTIFQSID